MLKVGKGRKCIELSLWFAQCAQLLWYQPQYSDSFYPKWILPLPRISKLKKNVYKALFMLLIFRKMALHLSRVRVTFMPYSGKLHFYALFGILTFSEYRRSANFRSSPSKQSSTVFINIIGQKSMTTFCISPWQVRPWANISAFCPKNTTIF